MGPPTVAQAHEQRLEASDSMGVHGDGPHQDSDSRHSLRANVKSSMTHHSLEQYVDPATTSSVWQPARKMGKQASDCSMLFWSMHALSSQSVGSLPVVFWPH